MTTSQDSLADTVQQIVDKHLNLTAHGYEFGADDDLWALGMTSLSCMGLMLTLEDTFEVELPEEALKEETFRSVGSITAAIEAVRSASETKV